MSKVLAEAWKCDVCLHVWMSAVRPDRCSQCKSRQWDKLGDKTEESIMNAQTTASLKEKVKELENENKNLKEQVAKLFKKTEVIVPTVLRRGWLNNPVEPGSGNRRKVIIDGKEMWETDC